MAAARNTACPPIGRHSPGIALMFADSRGSLRCNIAFAFFDPRGRSSG